MTAPPTAALDDPGRSHRAPRTPPAFYRDGAWRVGQSLGRQLPPKLLGAVAPALGNLAWLAQPARRRVVFENLLPVCNHERARAQHATRRLFRQFARKVADLWQWEAGRSMNERFHTLVGWHLLEEVHRRGRGALLVTPHLGNWEIGGSLLVERGLPLLVLTQAEPGADLTELRRRSRSRLGIETLVIGQDLFAAVEVVKQLNEGRFVALLIDRPPTEAATEVRLFGRPFRASTAPAELARATGCAVLGTQIIQTGGGYEARVLPEFTYDRRALGCPEAREAFTQSMMTAFEPALRRHPDQWYHFVPIWPDA